MMLHEHSNMCPPLCLIEIICIGLGTMHDNLVGFTIHKKNFLEEEKIYSKCENIIHLYELYISTNILRFMYFFKWF